ncbi:MAG: Vacuolar protein sorting-associated protein 62 [Sclerophora amabilis]|nr:MAG: Vacuolar protein sorting-associated protein 62 [Sclerophora amabilis]
MLTTKRAALSLLSTLFGFFAVFHLSETFEPDSKRITREHPEGTRWIANPQSWLGQTVCKRLSICGASHLQFAGGESDVHKEADQGNKKQEQMTGQRTEPMSAWSEGKSRPEEWDEDERVMRDIPQFVLDHAPLVHLFSDEQFWPCDIAEHLLHTTPHLNYTPLQGQSEHPNLTNLDDLNQWYRGRFVYLQSDDDVEDRPEWLVGQSNIPSVPDDEDLMKAQNEFDWVDAEGRVDVNIPDDIDTDREDWHEAGKGDTKEQGGLKWDPDAEATVMPKATTEGEYIMKEVQGRRSIGHPSKHGMVGGRSDAPAVLIVVDKGNGIVDAFWFYFYSFNLGNLVLNVRFGNHVGDWEHSMVRFQHGIPKAVWFSEHSFGDAYGYEAVEKIGKRPVVYSATGTHAMYATPGIHEYILPWGLLRDVTDRGPLWDPLLNSHMYTYDYRSDDLRSSNVTPHAPTEWFYFAGHWGDKHYPLSDPRQYQFAGEYHYVNGPSGPRFKNLGRKTVCQGNGPCHIRNWIHETRRKRRWVKLGEGEEISEDDLGRVMHRSEKDID